MSYLGTKKKSRTENMFKDTREALIFQAQSISAYSLEISSYLVPGYSRCISDTIILYDYFLIKTVGVL